MAGFFSMKSVPVMSAGIRSGVNWMRLNSSDRHRDSVLIMSVFASPGTPSSMQWPVLNSAISSSSITWSWPTMTRLSCCLMLSNADFSFCMASRSVCAHRRPWAAHRRSSSRKWVRWVECKDTDMIAGWGCRTEARISRLRQRVPAGRVATTPPAGTPSVSVW